MTGYSSKDAAISAVNLGAAAYLEKPFQDAGVVGKLIAEPVAKYHATAERRVKRQELFERNRVFWRKYKKLRSQVEQFLGTG